MLPTETGRRIRAPAQGPRVFLAVDGVAHDHMAPHSAFRDPSFNVGFATVPVGAVQEEARPIAESRAAAASTSRSRPLCSGSKRPSHKM